MPYAALRICSAPGCAVKVRTGRCPQHARQQRQHERRHYTAIRYDDPRWIALRDEVRLEQPFCAHRDRHPATCTLVTDDVDHIVPHDGDETLFLERTNLQGLCKSCHSRKTMTERHRGVSIS